MKHTVQFAISIDDQKIKNKIQKKLEEEAYDDIIDRLTIDAEYFLKREPGYYINGVDWVYYAREAIDKMIDENHDQIIERAAELLKDSFVRTKTYRETMKNAIPKS